MASLADEFVPCFQYERIDAGSYVVVGELMIDVSCCGRTQRSEKTCDGNTSACSTMAGTYLRTCGRVRAGRMEGHEVPDKVLETGQISDVFGQVVHGYYLYGKSHFMRFATSGTRKNSTPHEEEEMVPLFKSMFAYAGTYVQDYESGVDYIVRANGTKRIITSEENERGATYEELMAGEPGFSWSQILGWIFAGVAALAAVIVISLWLRRRAQGKAVLDA